MENGAICMYHDFVCSAISYARCLQFDFMILFSFFLYLLAFSKALSCFYDQFGGCWFLLADTFNRVNANGKQKKNVHFGFRHANGNSTALWVFVCIHFEPDLRPDKCIENFVSRVKIFQRSQLRETELWNCYPYIDVWDETWERCWNGPKNHRSIKCFFFTCLQSQHFALNVQKLLSHWCGPDRTQKPNLIEIWSIVNRWTKYINPLNSYGYIGLYQLKAIVHLGVLSSVWCNFSIHAPPFKRHADECETHTLISNELLCWGEQFNCVRN